MKIELYETYNIACHYLPAIVNGDQSGMTYSDIDWLQAWYRQLPPKNHIDAVSNSEVSDFCRDDISGLMADCYIVEVYEILN